MKLSEMLTWARSLSNLSSSRAISVDDEDKSFNASWKDLYARFLESNDDYFTKTVIYASLAGMGIAVNEYAIPLPEDFYQLRTAEYQDGTTAGTWLPLQKFPLSSRTDLGVGIPAYRLDNNNLWVKGQSVGAVRVKYYPPPALLTHPQPDLQYATAVTPNNFSLISSPVYAAWKNTGIYIYNVQNIAEGSIDDNSAGAPVTLLAAGANLSNLAYYKGYLYWLQGGNIKRAPTDLITSPLVPVNVIATTTVTSFGVFKDKLYYTDAGSMKYANLDGTGPTLILASAGTWLSLAGTTVYYIDGAAALKTTGGATLLASGVSACTSDGTNLYILTTLGEVRKLVVAAGVLVSNTVLRTDVTAIGPWGANRIPILTGETQMLLAFSSIIDSDITYPLNVVLEIMSYQAAIDFRTKIGGEFDFAPLYARLGHPKNGANGPATGLWARLEGSVRRDDYKPVKVSNSRRMAGNW